ncbi:hypothetical protein ASPZODRAFT_145929 [Penicilliopsis zonata CBS 506.65]|uniref:Uncharacterized protein n=1 Tax=Penicilliopsis zonata CBS 506.65 TaxID=1073090 RepID=A0A1L9S8T9_9EURO|nr:hypothetical protein ASPZODRAFT_145929 [Penicilliopsis zonata CBS 506.65]OJJ43575.1 hypothetical protein ASPZODRAFT_145929 [Penicilliopsis zonata CBS 506.65]
MTTTTTVTMEDIKNVLAAIQAAIITLSESFWESWATLLAILSMWLVFGLAWQWETSKNRYDYHEPAAPADAADNAAANKEITEAIKTTADSIKATADALKTEPRPAACPEVSSSVER